MHCGGGDRGVVASCSYQARRFGVRSGIPIKLARRLCPELIHIKGDMDQYSYYSNIINVYARIMWKKIRSTVPRIN